jgi:glutathione S-transferase
MSDTTVTTLYVLSGSLFSRRVQIYLESRPLAASFTTIIPVTQSGLKTTAPGKPPGSVPILALNDTKTTYIRQSIAILEYFEDLCDAAGDESSSRRGSTPIDRARTREIMSLADEATTHFSVACHKASAMFSLLEGQSPAAARFAIESCMQCLRQIESYYAADPRFVDFGGQEELILGDVSIADCVLFVLLQFAREMYAKDLTAELPMLTRFYYKFEEMDCAKVEKEWYPDALKMVASHWMDEDTGVWGNIWGRMKIGYLYVSALFLVAGGLLFRR